MALTISENSTISNAVRYISVVSPALRIRLSYAAQRKGTLLSGPPAFRTLFKTFSAVVFGIDAYPVEVEVDIGPSYQGNFNVVGLLDIAVKESRERIKSTLRNCGFDFPLDQAFTVNLAPVDIRKEGRRLICPWRLAIRGSYRCRYARDCGGCGGKALAVASLRLKITARADHHEGALQRQAALQACTLQTALSSNGGQAIQRP